MRYTLTYLGNSTIIVFDDGKMAFIDENLRQWTPHDHWTAGWIIFKRGTSELNFHCKTSQMRWYKNDQLHRVGGPAIRFTNRRVEWYYRGQLHRKGGPAIIGCDGTKEWWQYDRLHRDDGPAIVTATDGKRWFCRGTEILGDWTGSTCLGYGKQIQEFK